MLASEQSAQVAEHESIGDTMVQLRRLRFGAIPTEAIVRRRERHDRYAGSTKIARCRWPIGRSAETRRGRNPAEGRWQETVFVVEDDISVREALCGLLQSVGLQVQAFATPVDLLGNGQFGDASCMVVDIRLPGMSGLDFQAALAQARINTPFVFMSGHGDVPMTVRAMRAGAVDFLTKPFRDQDMLDAVATAIERNRARLSTEKATAELRAHLGTLSPARAGDNAARDDWPDEQAGGGSPRPERSHREDVPRPGHEEDGSEIPGRAREDGGDPGPACEAAGEQKAPYRPEPAAASRKFRRLHRGSS